MKTSELDKLLKIFKKGNIPETEFVRLYDLLNNKSKEQEINSHLYIQWMNSKNKLRMDSKAVFNSILKETKIEQTKLSKDQELFNYLNEKRFKPERFLIECLKYAAVVIIFISAGWLYLKNNPERIFRYNNPLTELSVPMGSKSSVLLSDGTKVWLNSGSKMKYPEVFYKDERKVYLEGEAYFEVSKSKNLNNHFIVSTTGLDIEVLGTRFNIKSYNNEKEIETTLLEGSLKIIKRSQLEDGQNEFTLIPNQAAHYNKQSKKLIVSNLDKPNSDQTDKQTYTRKNPVIEQNVEKVISWKDQTLMFDQETLEDISLKLERWYGKKLVILDDELKKESYTGKFRNNETIYQVLEALSTTTPIEITSVNNEIYIKKKKR